MDVREALEKAKRNSKIEWCYVVAVKKTYSKPYLEDGRWKRNVITTRQFADGQGTPFDKTYPEEIYKKKVVKTEDIAQECIQMSMSLKAKKSQIKVRYIYVARLNKSQVANSFANKAVEDYTPKNLQFN